MYPLLAAALIALVVPCQRGERLSQPCEYTSASGSYVLKVDPSDPQGKGPMQLRLVHGKEELWSLAFPWTFEEAGVSEDGTIIGYANGENLQIVVLDPKGAVRKQHDVKHTTWIVDGPALPMASGHALIHSAADLAFVRVDLADQSRPSPWWAFRLSTGERIDDVTPSYPIPLAENQDLYERDARAVGDTGLTLCYWLFADYRRTKLAWPENGGVFALVDLHGQPVWTLSLLDDYTDPASEQATDALEAEASRRGVILSVGPGDRFALWHVRPSQRVEYSVERDAAADKGWRVIEVNRSSHKPGVRQQTEAEKIILTRKATASLGSGSTRTPGPIHDIRQLGFADDGRVEFIREDGSKNLAFVRLTASGTLDFETDLSTHLKERGSMQSFYDLVGDRWLIQCLDQDPPWLEINVRTGDTKSASLPNGGLDCSIAPTADGGYLAVVPQIIRYTAVNELLSVQVDGSLNWRQPQWGVAEEDTPFEKAVYFAKGVVRVGEGKFVLLDMDALTTIDAGKNVLGSVDLAQVLGRDPIYVTDLLPDAKGGVYFHEGDSFWHVDAHGQSAGAIAPARADGSKDAAFDHLLRVAPDGRLWTSDRARIYRLDPTGTADLVLGPTQGEDELAHPEDSRIDSLGRVLIRDRITQAVHVFDSKGDRMHICKIDPAERADGSLWDSFRVARDGTTWVTVKTGIARFDSHGQRIRERTAGDTAEELGRGRFRVWDTLEAKDPRTAAFSSIRRRPDGRWLAGIAGQGVLPDGRLLILESQEEADARYVLHIYTAKGEPMRSIELPDGGRLDGLSISPRWIVVGEYASGLLLVRLEDWKVFRFEADVEEPGNWLCGQTPDGRSLLLLNAQRLQLAQYELP